MPRRETRHDIEREMAEHRRKRRILPPDLARQVQPDVERDMARQRKSLLPDKFAENHARILHAVHKLIFKKGPKRRRPGDGSMPALVEPPRGPKPLAGGAAAALEFD